MGARIQNPGHLYTSSALTFTGTSRLDPSPRTVQHCVMVSFTFCSFSCKKGSLFYIPYHMTSIYPLCWLLVQNFNRHSFRLLWKKKKSKKEKVMEQTHRAHIHTWVRVKHGHAHTHVTFLYDECVCLPVWTRAPASTGVSVGNREGRKERGEKDRKWAAVADSIRHAGLQCKLLYGHRCGFYGRNTGLF